MLPLPEIGQKDHHLGKMVSSLWDLPWDIPKVVFYRKFLYLKLREISLET